MFISFWIDNMVEFFVFWLLNNEEVEMFCYYFLSTVFYLRPLLSLHYTTFMFNLHCNLQVVNILDEIKKHLFLLVFSCFLSLSFWSVTEAAQACQWQWHYFICDISEFSDTSTYIRILLALVCWAIEMHFQTSLFLFSLVFENRKWPMCLFIDSGNGNIWKSERHERRTPCT